MFERTLEWFGKADGIQPIFSRFFNAAGASHFY
jgi:hypothetical protein